MEIKNIKKHFPILSQNPDFTYLDNAATTQKTKKVIKSISRFYRQHNANVHRGIYELSEKATEKYEEVRKTAAKFIGAKEKEIVFTSGTTDSFNLLARSLGKTPEIVKKNPKILITEIEHHANYLPWREISDDIHFARQKEDFTIEWPEGDFDIVSITHASNVTGLMPDAKEVRKKYPKALFILDAAQSIAHKKIDVKNLDVDFLAFSSHKMYGPTGIGVLYGKQELLEKLYPLKVGGGMIAEVTKKSAKWAELPERHEAGTPPIAQAIGLQAAIEFLEKIGMEKIEEYEKELRKYAFEELSKIKGLKLFHPNLEIDAGTVFSFQLEGIHPHDIAEMLSERNIAVRAGHHCCQILHREVLKIPASTRASFAVYNTKDDVDKLAKRLNEIVKIFT
ncbi:aminotransferase class V-fold PLP-dependent enzyme [Candidatus Dojkabacteria bacterium]|nr:aminotransferase class V-fold PLP-dependent enzyme [Candidatus Dojkabacteria bacterium]